MGTCDEVRVGDWLGDEDAVAVGAWLLESEGEPDWTCDVDCDPEPDAVASWLALRDWLGEPERVCVLVPEVDCV